MMHKNNVAFAIKDNSGRVLREIDGKVYLPFGSHYSIFVKNLDSVKIKLSVSIDGEDVLSGIKLVVDANSSIDLQRFIRNGNMKDGNKFLFIERSESVENFRGIKVDDGIVRIEFSKEIVIPIVSRYIQNPAPAWNRHPGHPKYYRNDVGSYPVMDSVMDSYPVMDSNSIACSTISCNAGITAPGEYSNQQFISTNDFVTESISTVMTLQLLGMLNTSVIEKPIDVSFKPKCVTCGRLNKASSKFCSNCGTSLQIV